MQADYITAALVTYGTTTIGVLIIAIMTEFSVLTKADTISTNI